MTSFGASRVLAEPGYRVGWLRWIVAGILLATLVVAWSLLPVSDWLASLHDWIAGLGFTGIVIFVAIYIAGAVVLAPEAVLTIFAGFVYGFLALPIVLVAATIGACLAFLIARHLARDRTRQLVEGRRNIAAINKAIVEDGWKIVALLRLSPLIPFNLQNYLFGLTAIPFLHFVAATFAGIIPGTVLYTYLGVLGRAAGNGDPARWIFFGIGLLATVIAVVLVARKAGTMLRAAGVDNAQPDASESQPPRSD